MTPTQHDPGWYPDRDYYRRRRDAFKALGLGATGKPYIRRWTGLSAKELGIVEYRRRHRELVKARVTVQ